MARSPWYLKKVKPTTYFSWTPEMRVGIYTMRVNDGLSIPEIQSSVEERVGRRPNKTRIHNVIRMMRKNIKRCCFRCGAHVRSKKPRGHLLVCKSCKLQLKEYKKALREKKLSNNLCGVCGQNDVENGYTYCRSCISITYRRRIKKGLCGWCGEKPIVKGSKAMCADCLEIDKLKGRRNRKKKKKHA